MYSKIKKEHLFAFLMLFAALVIFQSFGDEFNYTSLTIQDSCLGEGYSCCSLDSGSGPRYISLDSSCSQNQYCFSSCSQELSMITGNAVFSDLWDWFNFWDDEETVGSGSTTINHCSQLYSQYDCSAYSDRGCSWYGNSCQGSFQSCSSYSQSQELCSSTSGCIYASSSCLDISEFQGGSACEFYNDINEEDCDKIDSCAYTTSPTYGDTPCQSLSSFSGGSCSSLDVDQCNDESTTYCKYQNDACRALSYCENNNECSYDKECSSSSCTNLVCDDDEHIYEQKCVVIRVDGDPCEFYSDVVIEHPDDSSYWWCNDRRDEWIKKDCNAGETFNNAINKDKLSDVSDHVCVSNSALTVSSPTNLITTSNETAVIILWEHESCTNEAGTVNVRSSSNLNGDTEILFDITKNSSSPEGAPSFINIPSTNCELIDYNVRSGTNYRYKIEAKNKDTGAKSTPAISLVSIPPLITIFRPTGSDFNNDNVFILNPNVDSSPNLEVGATSFSEDLENIEILLENNDAVSLELANDPLTGKTLDKTTYNLKQNLINHESDFKDKLSKITITISTENAENTKIIPFSWGNTEGQTIETSCTDSNDCQSGETCVNDADCAGSLECSASKICTTASLSTSCSSLSITSCEDNEDCLVVRSGDECVSNDLIGSNRASCSDLEDTNECSKVSSSCRWSTVTNSCTDIGQQICGNGIKEGSESCDGTDFGSDTCQTWDYDDGNLACTSSCTRDISGCTYDELQPVRIKSRNPIYNSEEDSVKLSWTHNPSCLNGNDEFYIISSSSPTTAAITGLAIDDSFFSPVSNFFKSLFGKKTVAVRAGSGIQFEIQRKTNNGNFIKLAEFPSSTCNIEDKTISNNAVYTYKIIVKEGSESEETTTSPITIGQSPYGSTTTTLPPTSNIPTNLRSDYSGDNIASIGFTKGTTPSLPSKLSKYITTTDVSCRVKLNNVDIEDALPCFVLKGLEYESVNYLGINRVIFENAYNESTGNLNVSCSVNMELCNADPFTLDSISRQIKVEDYEYCKDGDKGENLFIDVYEPYDYDLYEENDTIEIELDITNYIESARSSSASDIKVGAALVDLERNSIVEEVIDSSEIDNDGGLESFSLELPFNVVKKSTYRLFLKAYVSGKETRDCIQYSLPLEFDIDTPECVDYDDDGFYAPESDDEYNCAEQEYEAETYDCDDDEDLNPDEDESCAPDYEVIYEDPVDPSPGNNDPVDPSPGNNDPQVPSSNGDSDDDGLPDEWELQYFNTLINGPRDDVDNDGISNLDEYLDNTDPSDKSDYLESGSSSVGVWIFIIIIVMAIIGVAAYFVLKPKSHNLFNKNPPSSGIGFNQPNPSSSNPKLKSYVNSSLAKGFTKDQIKDALRKKGWKDSEIDQAI